MAETALGIQVAAMRLSEAIRFRTVTSSDLSRTDRQEFLSFQAWLTVSYPLCHARMEKETFGPWGVLLRSPGSDPSLKPILLLAHYDVVPADDAELWLFPPFEGRIAEGYVWGRGALDVKNTVVSVMEAAESVFASGIVPERGFIIAFGGDEEIGGEHGAASIGARLAAYGIKPEFAIDEGSVISTDILPFLKRPAGLIGISEKGFLNLRVEMKGRSGHASMPGRSTAAGALARAVVRLESRPFPARMTRVIRLFLRACSPHAPFFLRPAFLLPRLFWPLIRMFFSRDPRTDALIRTSQAVTMLEASTKENVLPESASAVINIRVLPGQSNASAIARVRKSLAPLGAELCVQHPKQQTEAMAVSPTDVPAYADVVEALRRSVPEAVPLPFLGTVGTDTSHYAHLTGNIYRLMPLVLDAGELSRVHGVDERISLENLAREILFYQCLISGPSGPSPAAVRLG